MIWGRFALRLYCYRSKPAPHDAKTIAPVNSLSCQNWPPAPLPRAIRVRPHRIALFLLSLILSGAVSPLCAKPDDEVLARIDGQPITAAEVDALIRMPLHELDLARHELRTKALQRLIAARLKADSAAEASGHRVEILLERPLPTDSPEDSVGV